MTDDDLHLGTKIFFVLHYCSHNLPEQVKLSVFYDDLLKKQNPRTIVLATLNNILSSSSAIKDLSGIIEFFHELDKLYSFSHELTHSLMALSSFEQLHELAKMPFIGENYTNMITRCSEGGNCKELSAAIENSGVSLAVLCPVCSLIGDLITHLCKTTLQVCILKQSFFPPASWGARIFQVTCFFGSIYPSICLLLEKL